MTDINKILAQVDSNLPASLDRLFDFVRIPSISTSPDTADDVRKAAEWACAELASLGFDASVRETTGLPMVVAHLNNPAATKRVLFYGHVDVQPVDPLALWDTDPFDPQIVTRDDGSKKIAGRGTADDKGQLMTFVEACRAWLETEGEIPLNLTVLLEGEEETGSPSMNGFLEANKAELQADIGLVCDTGMWDAETPAITVMLRGLASMEVTLKAASRDLHSGLYGSAAANPLHIMARIVADLRDDNGSITLPGFYDGVEDPPAETKAQWDALDFDGAKFLGDVGLAVPAGEKDRTLLEQIWSRPTCEINGFNGGYAGDGTKTVIPAEANVKFTFRLVAGQDPEKILHSLKEFVEARIPADCQADIQLHGGAPAIKLPHDRAEVAAAAEALSAEWQTPCVLVGGGGSIPIVGAFQSILGLDSILAGFSLEDDRLHSPNEKYELTSFHKGTRSWVRIIDAVSKS